MRAHELTYAHRGQTFDTPGGDPRKLVSWVQSGQSVGLWWARPGGGTDTEWVPLDHVLSPHREPVDEVSNALSPSHYGSGRFGIECIRIARLMGFEAGNAFKYTWRWQEKNGAEDLGKALVYLAWAVDVGSPVWLSDAHRLRGQILIADHVIPALPHNPVVYRALPLIGAGDLIGASTLVTAARNHIIAPRAWKDYE